jgi:hypothetical protein
MFLYRVSDDNENEIPGSTDWFKLDGEVSLGRMNKRADLVKVEDLWTNIDDVNVNQSLEFTLPKQQPRHLFRLGLILTKSLANRTIHTYLKLPPVFELSDPQISQEN